MQEPPTNSSSPELVHMYKLPEPAFNSELTTLLFEIERMRANVGLGSTPREIYVELHVLFELLMSVVSARIEGNHTTVFEALDNESRGSSGEPEDRFRELGNISKAAQYIDTLSHDNPLTHSLVRELHEMVVVGLEREGDPTPGAYRTNDVLIAGAAHKPPSWVQVHAEMTELLDFANANLAPQLQMLQIALAHHRFVWIHPFSNGNGRASRLFTYAMLRRTVFSTRGYSALNPTSVFGNDRGQYVTALAAADGLTETGATKWATFFARGLRDDLSRLLSLQDHEYVKSQLLGPVIDELEASGIIDLKTRAVLRIILEQGLAKSGDFVAQLGEDASRRSRLIRQLIEQKLIKQDPHHPRMYQLNLVNGPLSYRLVAQLDKLGLLPKMLSDDEN